MRWTTKELLTGSLTLLCAVFVAGAARAVSVDADDVGSDPVRISRKGPLESRRLLLSLRPARDARLDVSDAASGVDAEALAMWSRIGELLTYKQVGDDYLQERRTFARPAPIYGIDRVHFSTEDLDQARRYGSRRDPCVVVPEPGTFGLLGCGMVGLGWLRRRSRRGAAHQRSRLYFRMHHTARTPSRQPIFLPSS